MQRNQLSLDGAVERERRDHFRHLHLQLSERAFGDSGRLDELVVQVVQVNREDTRGACSPPIYGEKRGELFAYRDFV